MSGHGKKLESHGAVLIVTMGTTQSEGRAVVQKCMKKMQAAYPKAEVTYAFTSEGVRLSLGEQGEQVPGPLGALSALIEKGHSQIVVQPLFLTSGALYHELYPVIKALNELAGAHGVLKFKGILISTPLVMSAEDYEETAKVLSSLYSSGKDEAVVLVMPTSEGGADPSLCQLQMTLDDITKTGKICIGTIDGYPDYAKVKSRLSHIGAKKVRLVPMAVVPGIHAWIQISGEANKDSWQKALERDGFTVTVDSVGLGEYDQILDLYVKRLQARAASHSFLK
ncbi:MAG: sirohydrochlorin cobaltochelatase [Methanospirillum sp.]|uniref:sirohydrochlorin cobaltochelatase n=1 Tax=Methanospirillum sp. TaxID=45200 RepID=UPI00236D1AAB|nr:sirohydrochlorin cobaltochelatase [Methanospirillum sp.]MDD1729163.1 sirohydrochlorin cobaltochelatase [Methanospirillum sp.]